MSTIMIISDNYDGAPDVLAEILTEEGYFVSGYYKPCNNPTKVKGQKVELFIVEIIPMYLDSGFQFVQALLEDTQTKKIPVLLTSTNEDQLKQMGSILGLDILPQPFDIDSVIFKVKNKIKPKVFYETSPYRTIQRTPSPWTHSRK